MIAYLAVEIAACLAATAKANGEIPDRYRKRGFLALHIALAVLGGGVLAELFSNGSAASAFYIGGSAPLVLDRLSKGVKPDANGEPNGAH